MAANSRPKKTSSANDTTPKLKKITTGTDTATGLDKLIHERTRLALVSALATHKQLTFNDLKSLLAVSDGNLSAHARKLEDAGYITCVKSFEGRLPRTDYRLSNDGRAALDRYIKHMEALIAVMKKG